MPWKVSGVVEERARFVLEYEAGQATMAALCRAYGISRKTGYKLWARYEAGGVAGLADRSRAARGHPNAVGEAMEAAILELRCAHMRWGRAS